MGNKGINLYIKVIEKMNLIKLSLFAFVLFSGLMLPLRVYAQVDQGQQQLRSQQFRLGERIIRVAEPGQLADTVNVWGDINSPGRYLIPKGTTLPELISYSFGPQTLRSNEAQLDWSKLRVEVNVSEYHQDTGNEVVKNFTYKFDDPLPAGMRDFELQNDQVIALQVKRRPSFVDYVRVVAPIVSTVATGFLIIDRL